MDEEGFHTLLFLNFAEVLMSKMNFLGEEGFFYRTCEAGIV